MITIHYLPDQVVYAIFNEDGVCIGYIELDYGRNDYCLYLHEGYFITNSELTTLQQHIKHLKEET